TAVELLDIGALAGEKARFLLLDTNAPRHALRSLHRILHERAERGVREAQAAVEAIVLELRERAQALRVAVEAEKVGALLCVEASEQGGMRDEPALDRVLTAMSERRIADIMRQASGVHDAGD